MLFVAFSTDKWTLNIFFDSYGRDMVPQYLEKAQVIVEVNRKLELSLKEGNNYLIFAENASTLSDILDRVNGSVTMWNREESPRGKFLIVTSSDDVKSIFKVLWDRNILNVAVLVDYQRRLYTSNPYHPKNRCKSVFAEYNVQECTGNLELQSISSFNGCPIYYASLNSSLVCLFHFVMPSMGTQRYEGSHSIFLDDFIWLVPLSMQASFTLIDTIFEYRAWICISLAFFGSLMVWWLIAVFLKTQRTYERFCHVCLDLFSLTTCGLIYRVPKVRALKCVLIAYLFYAIVIQTAFKANLIKALTVSGYNHEIDSLQKIATSKLPICISPILKYAYFSNVSEENELYKKITWKTYKCNVTSCEDITFPCIFMTLQSHLHLLALDLSKVKIIRNNSLNGKPEWKIHTFKGLQIVKPINRIINGMKESGIHKKLINDFNEEYERKKNVSESGPIALRVDHLRGVFVIYLFGIVLSLIVFVIEIVAHHRL
ncbi:hypothetical protein RI129_013175 [Pyrocoelia pectoralis]|uniref:Ionotropic glutamate receptor C-terminal domain-containing protein n=1 Tax=Pyrocoelia pectoralis TaxID=417401 RepID=A0AAN7UVS8_9COLE